MAAHHDGRTVEPLRASGAIQMAGARVALSSGGT